MTCTLLEFVKVLTLPVVDRVVIEVVVVDELPLVVVAVELPLVAPVELPLVAPVAPLARPCWMNRWTNCWRTSS